MCQSFVRPDKACPADRFYLSVFYWIFGLWIYGRQVCQTGQYPLALETVEQFSCLALHVNQLQSAVTKQHSVLGEATRRYSGMTRTKLERKTVPFARIRNMGIRASVVSSGTAHASFPLRAAVESLLFYWKAVEYWGENKQFERHSNHGQSWFAH